MSKTHNTKNTVPFFNNAVIPNPISGDLYEIMEDLGIEPRFAQKGDSGEKYAWAADGDRYRLVWESTVEGEFFVIYHEGVHISDGVGSADDMVRHFLGIDEDWMPA